MPVYIQKLASLVNKTTLRIKVKLLLLSEKTRRSPPKLTGTARNCGQAHEAVFLRYGRAFWEERQAEAAKCAVPGRFPGDGLQPAPGSGTPLRPAPRRSDQEARRPESRIHIVEIPTDSTLCIYFGHGKASRRILEYPVGQ